MYESFYGLNKRPFALIPDSGFLFPSATHRRALSYLIYGLGQREGFIVITGDVGTGKTLTIQSILDYLATHHIYGMRIAAANVKPEDVLMLVATSLGIPSHISGKANLLAEVERLLLTEHSHGVLLIVDEAQTFRPEALEELRILSNLSFHGRALIQIALVGQSDLRDVLNSPGMEQLHQRIIAWHQLEPFKIDETSAYIQHRLKTAGWSDLPKLGSSIYPLIQEWSGGVPRKINLLMDRFLLYGYLEEKKELTEVDLSVVIAEMQNEMGDVRKSTSGTADLSCQSPSIMHTLDPDHVAKSDIEHRLIELERSMVEWIGVSDVQDMMIEQEHLDGAGVPKEIGLAQRVARLELLFTRIRSQKELKNTHTKKNHG